MLSIQSKQRASSTASLYTMLFLPDDLCGNTNHISRAVSKLSVSHLRHSSRFSKYFIPLSVVIITDLSATGGCSTPNPSQEYGRIREKRKAVENPRLVKYQTAPASAGTPFLAAGTVRLKPSPYSADCSAGTSAAGISACGIVAGVSDSITRS